MGLESYSFYTNQNTGNTDGIIKIKNYGMDAKMMNVMITEHNNYIHQQNTINSDYVIEGYYLNPVYNCVGVSRIKLFRNAVAYIIYKLDRLSVNNNTLKNATLLDFCV